MKTYVRSAFIVFLVLLTFPLFPGTVQAFRCGNSLVTAGDTRAEVIHNCGEPDFVDSWEEERISRDYRTESRYDPRTDSYRRYREPLFVKETVKIDVWTYNLGSNQFIRYLTFENGILTEIKTGERGY